MCATHSLLDEGDALALGEVGAELTTRGSDLDATFDAHGRVDAGLLQRVLEGAHTLAGWLSSTLGS